MPVASPTARYTGLCRGVGGGLSSYADAAGSGRGARKAARGSRVTGLLYGAGANGQYPPGLYEFVTNFQRYTTRWYGYAHLLTDEYPPFSGSADISYPVDLHIGPAAPEYSRWKAALRIFLAIPVALIAYATQIVAQIGAFLAWFAIVVTGKQPRALQDMTTLGLSYYTRANPYCGLVTEDWPAFTDEQGQVDPGSSAGPLPPGGPEAPNPSGSFAPPRAPEADA